MEKTCFKCGALRPMSEFYKHPQMGDGTLGKCKECTKLDSRANYHRKIQDPSWRLSERERSREKAKRCRSHGITYITSKEAKLRWSKANPHKKRAQLAARRAHPTPPAICPNCGSSGVKMHRHHPDYSKPKEIVWLCTACHGLQHRKKDI